MICLMCFILVFYKMIMHCDLLLIHCLKSSIMCALRYLGVWGKFSLKVITTGN